MSQARAALESAGVWRLTLEREGLWVFTGAVRPVRIRSLDDGPGVLIGDVFHAADNSPLGERLATGLGRAADIAAVCQRLTQIVWGSYVAIFEPVADGAVGVFRDPIGGLDCVAWARGGLTIAASELPDALLITLGPPLAIDWARVASFVTDAAQISTDLALTGLTGVFPGTLCRWTPTGEHANVIWRPSAFARAVFDGDDPAAALARCVDGCIRAWAQLYSPAMAELSGGLDSAIVGAALVQANADVRQWVNFHIADPVGDERGYARALAAKFAVDLTEEPKSAFAFDPAGLAEVMTGPRPTLNGSDGPYDQDMAGRCARLGVAAQFTGQGGDALFFQMPTALAAVDHLYRLGFPGLVSPFLGDVARWARCSIWSILRETLIEWTGLKPRTRRGAPSFVSEAARHLGGRAPAHPWLCEVSDLPPAKRLHIEALAFGQVYFGDCRRARSAALIHPLLSQPLVELCLSIPVDTLVEGGRDRGLARRAFADRLAPCVTERRSKGDLNAFYGHAIAASLDALRPYLIEGRLAAQGVVDSSRLSALLTIDSLAREGGYVDLVDLAVIEAWVRAWEGRIERSQGQAQGLGSPGPIKGARKAKALA